GNFRSAGVGRELNGTMRDIDFFPFYRLHRRAYALYWDLYTTQGWEKKTGEIAAEQAKQRELEAATMGFAQPGDPEKEKNFNLQGEETTPDRAMGRTGRRGKKWFSFDLPVDPAHAATLIVTYLSE